MTNAHPLINGAEARRSKSQVSLDRLPSFSQNVVRLVFGMPRAGDRGTYRAWEEGKAADFVLEVASPTTVDNDARHKAGVCARIGAREYWRLDPKGSLMARPLEGYELVGVCTPVGFVVRSLLLTVGLLSCRTGSSATAPNSLQHKSLALLCEPRSA